MDGYILIVLYGRNKEFILRINTQESICRFRDIEYIEYRINPFSFDKEKVVGLKVNEVASVIIETKNTDCI